MDVVWTIRMYTPDHGHQKIILLFLNYYFIIYDL